MADDDVALNDELFGSDLEDDFDEDEDDETFEEVPIDIKITNNKKQAKKSTANKVSTNSTYNEIFNIDYADYDDIEKDPTVMNFKQLKSENNIKPEVKIDDKYVTINIF